MRQLIDIKVPTCWQQLSDKQLRFVFKLLNGNLRSANSLRHVFDKYICRRSSDLTVNFSLPQVKALCLLKWAKMKILRREGSIFIMKYNKQTFPVTALQITEVTQSMEWLGDFPVYPVRLSRIGLHRPIPANFQGVPFGTFLALDNLYQGYFQTRKHDIAIDMARIMYQSKPIHHLSKVEEIKCSTGSRPSKDILPICSPISSPQVQMNWAESACHSRNCRIT